MSSIKALRQQAINAFAAAGIADPDTEAAYLLMAALDVDRLALLNDAPVAAETITKANEWIKRRAAREPLDRIMGTRGFYSLEFGLNEATLSPRADTETLVDAALALKPERILDIGTGTGCVALALLNNLPKATAVATDISARALQQAGANAEALGLAHRITFVETNYADGIDGLFDVIVSNPPYIPAADVDTLDDEVRLHDPRTALDGGADGLDAYRTLLATTPALLQTNGRLLFEIGAGQVDDILALAQQAGWHRAAEYADLGGITRVLAFFR